MKLTVIVLLVLFLAVSCDRCDPSNSFDGIIIEEATIRSVGIPNQPLLITSEVQTNLNLEVRMPGSITFEPVNFTQHAVLAFPTTSTCSSGFERIVERDDANERVIYTINITQCDDCEGLVSIGNWVLIPAVPPNYTADFVLND